MKKIGRLFKEIAGNRLKSYFKDANSIFIVQYSGISSPDLSALRQSLKSIKARIFVVRNNLSRRILKDLGYNELASFIEGPCGFVFAKDEPPAVSKILYAFSKEHEQLKLRGGSLKERLLLKDEIESLARLPDREVLRAQVVGALNAPLVKLVMVLKGNLRKLVYCLEQIREKKGGK